jgi:anion-transporting  ArsA/GET3 family ATPase
MHRKELGAFYTTPAYCKKATELVRKAIAQIPKEHDYIILDRCAGTGNLLEFLTDKNVDDITLNELYKYFSEEFVNKFVEINKLAIQMFVGIKNINNITIAELEKYAPNLTIREQLFDNELSHCVVNTFELKE